MALRHLFAIFLHLGWGGLVILGILDSSFLFVPIGNDLLLVVLVAKRHSFYPIYVAAAAFGSAMGVLLLDLVTRKEGEEGLRRMMGQKRFAYLEKKFEKRVWVALVVACLAPPPFPFTPVVAAASAFQYPRPHLLSLIFGGRVIRFGLVGLLAIYFGEGILNIIKKPQFFWFVIAFIIVCAIGSGFSIAKWIKRSPAEG
ncbi:MAG TPA: hypothetical protein VFW83_07175 [Bryobacteraceae bacterium]|nr:hypothetical protein [Bryobacteraceae bacterium]